MGNIKNFRLFLIRESSEIEDAFETVFAEFSDRFIIDIHISDKDTYYVYASISFRLDNLQTYYNKKWFNTSEFTDRISQLKDYLGKGYRFLYSYETMNMGMDHVTRLPVDMDITKLKITILNN